MIAPFADETNRHLEVMLADLISGPLRGQEFRFHRADPQTRRPRDQGECRPPPVKTSRQALEKAAVELGGLRLTDGCEA